MDKPVDTSVNIIILADAHGEELLPLTSQTSPVMLPICGRPTIDHVLESLAQLTINQMELLVCSFSSHIRKFVGNGQRWGVDVKYVVTRGNSTLSDAAKRTMQGGDAPYLIIDMRYFNVMDVESVLAHFKAKNDWLSRGMHRHQECGVYFIDPSNYTTGGSVDSAIDVEIPLDMSQPIHTLFGYYTTNIVIAQDRPERIIIRGKQLTDSLTVGPASVVAEQNVESGTLIAGERCQLQSDVRCSGTVILGDNVVVDRNTTLKNSVVLENSFIGEHLHIENAIVWRNHLIRVDNNTAVTLEDDRLLGSMSSTAFSVQIGRFVGRAVAVFLLILLFPFWLIAVVDAATNTGKGLFKRFRLVGNAKLAHQPHRAFASVEFNSRSKNLAKLPMLWNIATGNINWFGVAPCEFAILDDRSEHWQFMRDQYPVGLIGPAQIELDDQASIDEILMADATFPASSKWSLLLRSILQLVSINHLSTPVSKTSSR